MIDKTTADMNLICMFYIVIKKGIKTTNLPQCYQKFPCIPYLSYDLFSMNICYPCGT